MAGPGKPDQLITRTRSDTETRKIRAANRRQQRGGTRPEQQGRRTARAFCSFNAAAAAAERRYGDFITV